MDNATKSGIRLFAVYCGPLYVLALLVGWGLIAGFLPPHSPITGEAEIAAVFLNEHTRIRIGMVIVMYAALVVIPFVAVTSYFLSRIEGGVGVLTGMALLGGAGTMVLTFYPAIWWLVAAFRPDRAADLIYIFNDMAWLQFIGGVSMYDAIPLAIAIAAFCDKSANPVFPRWAGYYNVMVILMLLPDQLLFFFHSGVFAWNGLFGFWIPLVLFGSWFFVNFWLMRKAILRERGIPDTGNVPAGVH